MSSLWLLALAFEDLQRRGTEETEEIEWKEKIHGKTEGARETAGEEMD